MPETAPNTRASYAWIAPSLSTLVTLPAAFCALVFALLSPMICDSCSDAERA